MDDAKAITFDRVNASALEADVVFCMDEEAFRLFYQRTSRPLWAYLSRVSGDRQRADDLLQESYYRFLKSNRQFASETHQRHYLFRIATNLVLDDRRRPQLEFATLPGESDPGAPRAPGPDVSGLGAALARLKPRERSLLWLAYAQGASHDEIAAQTGLTSGSVKQLLFRARRRLAALLGGRP